MKKFLILLLTSLTGLTQAQDMFYESLFSADRIMKNREIISLTDAQAEKIKKIQSANASDFTTLKWDLDDATIKLKTLLAEPKPNQELVQKHMDQVLILENSLKKKQLSNLVAIKNELTENQQETLKNVKTYNLAGISSTLPPSTPQFRIGKPTPDTATNSKTENTNVYIQTTPKTPNSQPLYVIKTEYGHMIIPDVNEISPNDIVSIDVWKGDKAIEKFGQRGKNGAIIITLKKDNEHNLF